MWFPASAKHWRQDRVYGRGQCVSTGVMIEYMEGPVRKHWHQDRGYGRGQCASTDVKIGDMEGASAQALASRKVVCNTLETKPSKLSKPLKPSKPSRS